MSGGAANADADALGFAAARHICRRQVRGLYLASFLLPRAKRDAARAVGAFFRMAADAIAPEQNVADGASGLREYPAVAAPDCCDCEGTGPDARVVRFNLRLAEIYDGTMELPEPLTRSEQQHALHAFALTARRHDLPVRHFFDFAAGFRLDRATPRYATWAALERSCYYGAGAAALAFAGVFGLTNSGAAEHAVKLGAAIRLTGILRDLKADRARSRVYLPLEDLARFRYSERDLAAGVVNDAFRALMKFEIARARQLYREAAEGLCWVGDDRARLAAAALAVTSAGLLREIERRDYDVFAAPPRLSAARKLRLLPDAWRLARARPGGPPADIFG